MRMTRVMRSLVFAILAISLATTSCLDRSDGVDTAVQMQRDIETIDSYIVQNGLNAYYDKTGVRFIITELGTKGFPPRTEQGIKVKYKGMFLDGTVFDAGPTAEGALGSFIYGWQYGLAVWPAGTKGTLFVPSPLGYGPAQVNSIPPNSILKFEIELTEVVVSNADKARLAADIATIDAYLEEHSIDAVKDSTGVRYVVTEPGAGAMPGLFSKVKFKYTGRAMATDTEFFNGGSEPSDIFDSRVTDFINGIKVGLMKVAIGGKVTIYVPSTLAFGNKENNGANLPANSIVIYDIELENIIYD